jgi:hypothetical protein
MKNLSWAFFERRLSRLRPNSLKANASIGASGYHSPAIFHKDDSAHGSYLVKGGAWRPATGGPQANLIAGGLKTSLNY